MIKCAFKEVNESKKCAFQIGRLCTRLCRLCPAAAVLDLHASEGHSSLEKSVFSQDLKSAPGPASPSRGLTRCVSDCTWLCMAYVCPTAYIGAHTSLAFRRPSLSPWNASWFAFHSDIIPVRPTSVTHYMTYSLCSYHMLLPGYTCIGAHKGQKSKSDSGGGRGGGLSSRDV